VRSCRPRNANDGSSSAPIMLAWVPPLVPAAPRLKYPISTRAAVAPASRSARVPGTRSYPNAVSSAQPARAARGPSCSKTRRMNWGSPVESMYVARASIAASIAAAPDHANGPTVESRTSPGCTSAGIVSGREMSAIWVSRPPSSPASLASRSSEQAASTGRAPRVASARAVSSPVWPVAPKRTIRPGITRTGRAGARAWSPRGRRSAARRVPRRVARRPLARRSIRASRSR
jgi:hypothetical protein